MRPVAKDAVSERERMKACPHRDQAAVNLERAKAAEMRARMEADEALGAPDGSAHIDARLTSLSRAFPARAGRRRRK